MRVSPCWLAGAACLLSTAAASAQTGTSSDSSATFFRTLISTRATAHSRADTAGYRRLVDPALVYLEDDGTRQTLD